jgi:hypothetical protein
MMDRAIFKRRALAFAFASSLCLGLAVAEDARPVLEKWSGFTAQSQRYEEEVRGISMTYWKASQGTKGLVLRIKADLETDVKVPMKDFAMKYSKGGAETSVNCLGMTSGIDSEEYYPTWMLETRGITNIVYLSKGPVVFELLFALDSEAREATLLYKDQVLLKKYKLK